MHLVSAEKKMALEPENVPKDTAYAVFVSYGITGRRLWSFQGRDKKSGKVFAKKSTLVK